MALKQPKGKVIKIALTYTIQITHFFNFTKCWEYLGLVSLDTWGGLSPSLKRFWCLFCSLSSVFNVSEISWKVLISVLIDISFVPWMQKSFFYRRGFTIWPPIRILFQTCVYYWGKNGRFWNKKYPKKAFPSSYKLQHSLLVIPRRPVNPKDGNLTVVFTLEELHCLDEDSSGFIDLLFSADLGLNMPTSSLGLPFFSNLPGAISVGPPSEISAVPLTLSTTTEWNFLFLELDCLWLLSETSFLGRVLFLDPSIAQNCKNFDLL